MAGASEVIPGLDNESIRLFARKWKDGGLWDDVAYLADKFWSASDEEERLRSWHHVVVAVGNFKRPPGRRLRPASLGSLPTSQPQRASSVSVPGARHDLVLGVDDASTWEHLCDSLPGAAVATTTTLLAALWPEQHFIFDWRVHAAAAGLRVYADLSADVDPDSCVPTTETFRAYGLVRPWVLESAYSTGTTVVEVERSLYQLSQEVADVDERSWREYGRALRDLLRQESRR